jgi:UDP-N-acetylmuramate dehydrogenase
MNTNGIINNQNLASMNTFGMKVSAERFAVFRNLNDLSKLQLKKEKNLFVLGGGSNVLLTKDFSGLVVKNEITGITIEQEDADTVTVKVGAGENWHEFVTYCIQNNWGGIENLSLIPGNVGASPMQNIGAYGVEIKDVFVSLEAYEIATGKLVVFDKEACQFGYRESVFKRALKGKYIITSVTFQLHKKPVIKTSYGAIQSELEKMGVTTPTIKDVSDAVIAIRRSKLPDPKELGNAGSFFKNPVVAREVLAQIQEQYTEVPHYPIDNNHVKIPAGWLIEKAGWKGKRFDNYGVHQYQALVLVNYGGAKGEEILNLSEKIIQDILQKFQIQLEREVNIL